MADLGNVELMLAGLPDAVKRIMQGVFKYILKDIRFGRCVAGDPSQNMGGGFFTGTTASVANVEFTIAHSFGRTPYLCIPVLPLNTVNAKIVRLRVTRAADANRMYFDSPDVDSAVYLYVEG
jgi:hypothetical protein